MEEIDILNHSGVAHDENPPGRGSGRYPWGTGNKKFQRPRNFLDRVNAMKSQGMTETQIAEALGIYSRDSRHKDRGSPNRLRSIIRIAQHEEKLDLIRQVKALSEQGIGATEGAKMLGLPNESSFRSYLKAGSENRYLAARETADDLVRIMNEKGKNIQVGEGVAINLNISQDRLNEALELLYLDGYEIHGGRVPTPNNPEHQTTIKLLCPPGTPSSAAYDYDNQASILDEYISHDGKRIETAFQYPASMDSKRLMIRYAEDGGLQKDGTIELRPGVKDLSLGDRHYAQVRILVDGTHYLKGMAIYGDEKDFPPGVDAIFNTNKAKGTPALGPKDNTVLKLIKNDPNNPFNTTLREHGGQSYWTDDNGEQHLSLINKLREEGDWDLWSKELPSQFLSKQPKDLVKRQLDISKRENEEELSKISSLTNDTVKKILLEQFADKTDGKAVSLKAAQITGQRYQVLLPINSLKDDEVYAPNFEDGSTVSLIRFPHAGLFEIPTLKVNNKNAEGNRVITPDGLDAIGINSNVFKQLSGADADGDTALVIPHGNGVRIQSSKPLSELVNFDIELKYGKHDGMTVMNPKYQQKQMGVVSNLITDMTLVGAPESEIARAVKHSMVVIDAVKHEYDYKQSEIDNDIRALSKKYQRTIDENGNVKIGGASTIVSRAKNPRILPYSIENGKWVTDPKTGKIHKEYIDRETGEKLETHVQNKYRIYKDPITGERLYGVTGKPDLLRTKDGSKTIPRSVAKVVEKVDSTSVPAMKTVKDAMQLVSYHRNPKEILYAEYANFMKSQANKARKMLVNLKPPKMNHAAKNAYKDEIDSLNRKYTELEKRKPIETAAKTAAQSMIKVWYLENPHASSEEKSKQRQKILTMCRRERGLSNYYNSLQITPKEWEAIQAGAFSASKVEKLLRKADMSVIQQYAMPSSKGRLTQTQINRIRSMSNSGRSNSQIAEALNVNVSTVIRYLRGDE